MENMFEILACCPLFKGMDAARIEGALDPENISVEKFSRGELIAERDTAYSGLMIILKGSATGSFTYPSGECVAIEAVEAPQLIAPAFLFGGYNRLPVDVVADGDTQILTLHRGYLFELMQQHTLILSNFIDIISNRAGVWQKRIYALSYRSLKEKLASYLLDRSSPSQTVVPMPDIPTIAELFGATRSSMLSVVEGLARRRTIRMEGENIVILNRRALQDILK